MAEKFNGWDVMTQVRLKTSFVVSAMLRQAMLADKPGVVVHKGDADAGGVLVKLYSRTGCVVLSRFQQIDGRLGWLRATGAQPVAEEAADAYIARQTGFDPDLWVLEFEAPDHLPPFADEVI